MPNMLWQKWQWAMANDQWPIGMEEEVNWQKKNKNEIATGEWSQFLYRFSAQPIVK